MTEEPVKSARQHLALATISFTLCFAAWGLISAFAPRFRTLFALSATQTALLVAVPVILGSLARIPMGMLSDRFGGRSVFTSLMVVSAIPVFFVPRVTNYEQLLVVAFFLGLAGSSFAVGVNYVSRWTPAEQQGGALGVYGLGNIGQSFAVFLGPVLAGAIGLVNVYSCLGVALLAWAVVFAALARNPEAARPRSLREMRGVL